MGGDADWRPADYCAVVFDDSVGIREIFQALSLYCPGPGAVGVLCRLAQPECRQKLLKKLLCRVPGRSGHIVLACIIFSVFAAFPPAIDPGAAAVSMVWSYTGELVFNMLVLVGTVKMADHVVKEMMGL